MVYKIFSIFEFQLNFLLYLHFKNFDPLKKILFFLLISNYIFAQWSISNGERSALISIYNSTNGDHWSSSWNLEKDPKTWYGIKVKNGSVTEINLRGNALKGNFPTNLSAFSQLEKLDLSSNQLQGDLSSGISGLTQLIRLDISNNRLSGDPSLTLASLSQLEELSIGNNFFAINDVDGFLQNFTKIKVLDLSKLNLNTVPQKLSTYTNLEVLNLSNNVISQKFNIVNGLSKLTDLDLSGNQLTTIPAAIGLNVNLKSLNLSNNNFSANYSAPLSTLKNLEWLSLEINQIENFPTELNQLTKLIHLNFGRNKISGGLSSLLNLTNLEQLFLNNNTFSGEFPTELLQLKKLQMLALTSNQFSGEIPQNIPALTFIENNRFNETQIRNFLSLNKDVADFRYSPQRYDEETTIAAAIGGNANLTQSISGENYQFSWFKTLDKNINVSSPNYTINSVKEEDFDVYTCEAYFVKNYQNFLMEVSFFREPITLDRTLAIDEIAKNITIYPNPTKDFIHIRSNNIKVESSTIYDLSGKQIFTSKDSIIDVKSLPSAVYLISIKTLNGIKTFKWIKN